MVFTIKLQPTTPEAAEFYMDYACNGENAGFDLFMPREVRFAPGERKFVSLEVKAIVCCSCSDSDSENKEQNFWMVPRSSISKTGLMMMNSVGVIDKTYRGDLIAALWNTTDKEVVIQHGHRLVQIVGPTMESFHSIQVVKSIDETGTRSGRGTGGFGSTGL
jgi:dUTP pyrophosphatase